MKTGLDVLRFPTYWISLTLKDFFPKSFWKNEDFVSSTIKQNQDTVVGILVRYFCL